MVGSNDNSTSRTSKQAIASEQLDGRSETSETASDVRGQVHSRGTAGVRREAFIYYSRGTRNKEPAPSSGHADDIYVVAGKPWEKRALWDGHGTQLQCFCGNRKNFISTHCIVMSEVMAGHFATVVFSNFFEKLLTNAWNDLENISCYDISRSPSAAWS